MTFFKLVSVTIRRVLYHKEIDVNSIIIYLFIKSSAELKNYIFIKAGDIII